MSDKAAIHIEVSYHIDDGHGNTIRLQIKGTDGSSPVVSTFRALAYARVALTKAKRTHPDARIMVTTVAPLKGTT